VPFPASNALRARLAAGHPIAMMMDEHRTLLAHHDRLAALCSASAPPSRRTELLELAWLSGRLVGAERHCRREERVLIPALEERGVHAPAELASEHDALRGLQRRLQDLARCLLAGEGGAWQELCAVAGRLGELFETHVAGEEGLLYPLALRVIRKPAEWEELRRRCDEIGYCCPLAGEDETDGSA
jgi:hemerythrin-like domain-containing protein